MIRTVSGTVAGLAVAMPIGAVGSYLIGLAARERPPTAAAAALGIASVDGVYAVMAAFAGAGVHELLSEANGWLRWVAAITLVVVVTTPCGWAFVAIAATPAQSPSTAS